MEVRDLEALGKTVVVFPGEDLRSVPKSHQDLLCEEVRVVFRDVPAYFARIADYTPFRRLAAWLKALVQENDWRLMLHHGWTDRVGFRWDSPTVAGAEIGLPIGSSRSAVPKSLIERCRREGIKFDAANHIRPLTNPLAALFRSVGFVDWSGVEGGGMIFHPEWIQFHRGVDPEWVKTNPPVDWEDKGTMAWGGFNGEYLFATVDDRAGWIGMGNHDVKFIGTVAEAIDWWFGMLFANTSPTMDRVKAA